MKAAFCALFSALLLSTSSLAQLPTAPASPGPDPRYKADILLVLAHPDDETLIAGYLARESLDEHKRIAAIYGNCGDTGMNGVGYEEAKALCAVRKMEVRRALGSIGITNVWFLGGQDTAGQNVLDSLENWGDGAVLDRVVRYVRLTEPDVIITWLPDYVDGENHGDHQAAGVLATEAFDLAANPTVFPEQVATPRNRNLIGNRMEGLRPWQPKKLYYFQNAAHPDFAHGKGPQYSTTDVSPSRHVPYYQLAAEELSYHLSQSDYGAQGRQAVIEHSVNQFKSPIQFIFGKSLVGGDATGDIFQNISSGPIPYHAVRGYQPQPRQGISIEIGGPWAFYQLFWRAHDLEHLANLIPQEAGVGPGMYVSVPLIIRNDTSAPAKIALTAVLPPGWTQHSGAAIYDVAAHDSYPTRANFTAPKGSRPTWQQIVFTAKVNGNTVSTVALRVSNSASGPVATLHQ